MAAGAQRVGAGIMRSCWFQGLNLMLGYIFGVFVAAIRCGFACLNEFASSGLNMLVWLAWPMVV